MKHDLTQLASYKPEDNFLKGKVILVSGAGDGIGKAAAITYAKYGANVILLGRTEEKLNKVYDLIEEQGSTQPVVVTLDLKDCEEPVYHKIAEQVLETFGKLDGLLLNAGILGEIKPLTQYSGSLFQEVLNVNVTSQFLLCKALTPALGKAENASVIFTSSSVGRKGRAYWGAYSVSKFATEGLMQVYADEIENTSSIRTNSINPGATRTSMRGKAYPAENPSKLPNPEDIMGAYLFLMSDDSIDLNGKALDAQKK